MTSEEALSNHVTTAMGQYARRYTAAVVVNFGVDHIEVGSATCVRIGSRFLLATAGHNFDGVSDDSQIRVVPPSGTIDERVPFRARNSTSDRGDSTIDVAWLEIEPDVAANYGLDAVSLDRLKPYEVADNRVLYLAKGFPAALSRVVDLNRLREIHLTSIGYLSIPSKIPVKDSSIDLALEYAGTAISSDSNSPIEMAHPKGMSGGGIWTITNHPYAGIWDPNRCQCVAIVRSYDAAKRQLLGVPMQHWMTLVARDFPELSGEIDNVLRRPESAG